MSKMASSNTNVKILQHCQISPPQGSVPSTILPLTFLDIPWLLFSPNQPLFFFEFPHFTQNILINLKHSLSLTLEHFFLLAGNLVVSPQPSKPHFSYTEGDSVSLIIAESNVGDFSFLSCHEQPRNIQPFHQLVPQLKHGHHHDELVDSSDTKKHPLLAIQITIFPGFGICLGFALRQVAADGRTFDNFLKTWASICKSCTPQMGMLSKFSPCYDRALILDPRGLEQIFLKQWRYFKSQHHQEVLQYANGGTSITDEIIVRATFVVGPTEMERIKGWITTRSAEVFGSTRLYLSPYVLVCAFVWVCWTKTHLAHIEHFLEEPHYYYFGFNAGGINRLGYSVPNTYVGNCIGFGQSMIRRDHLMGENGILYAAKAIGDTIKELDRKVLGKAENWIFDWDNLLAGLGSDPEPHIVITGSPKVTAYQLDFGWGRPKKIEEISIDKTRAISLFESRDLVGGIEVGLSLPKVKMDIFHSLFQEIL